MDKNIKDLDKFSLEEILEYKFDCLLEHVNPSKSNNHNFYNIVLESIEKSLFKKVISKTGNNQSKASEMLGINRNTLKKKLLKYNLI